jgi:co-chaperonin GroES (HSP10)
MNINTQVKHFSIGDHVINPSSGGSVFTMDGNSYAIFRESDIGGKYLEVANAN